MSEDQFLELFKYMEKRFDAVEKRFEKQDDKFDRIMAIFDSILKQNKTDEQERLVVGRSSKPS